MLCVLGSITYLDDNQDIQIGYQMGYQSIRAFFLPVIQKINNRLAAYW
jgi:hypothetical protein